MSLEDFLIEGEEIIAAASDDYFATSKRVIKYRKKLVREEFEDLAYPHITSLKLVNRPSWGFIVAGFNLAVLGGLGWYFEFDIAEIIGTAWQHEYIFIAYSLIGIGVILIILGFIFRDAFYQLRAAGINPGDWRIQRPVSVDTTGFIKTIREHLNR